MEHTSYIDINEGTCRFDHVKSEIVWVDTSILKTQQNGTDISDYFACKF